MEFSKVKGHQKMGPGPTLNAKGKGSPGSQASETSREAVYFPVLASREVIFVALPVTWVFMCVCVSKCACSRMIVVPRFVSSATLEVLLSGRNPPAYVDPFPLLCPAMQQPEPKHKNAAAR